MRDLRAGQTQPAIGLLEGKKWGEIQNRDRVYLMKRKLLETLAAQLHSTEQYRELLHWAEVWRELDERDVTAMAYWYEALRHTPDRREEGTRGLKEAWQRFPSNEALTRFLTAATLVESGNSSAVAEMTKTPFMLQQCGGFINRAFLAHQVAVMRMATIDHVDICHLWKEDVTVQSLGVVSGSVQVPEGPGLGVELDRNKLERCINEPFEPPPSLVRVSHGDGLKVYVRHNPNLPGCNDNLRFYDRLHGFSVPGPEPSYANKVVCDFWEGDDNPEKFKLLWEKAATGPIWTNDE